MAVGQVEPLRTETVEVGRVQHLAPQGAQVAAPQVVGQDDDDIRPLGGRLPGT